MIVLVHPAKAEYRSIPDTAAADKRHISKSILDIVDTNRLRF
jgi:hypothetical protein